MPRVRRYNASALSAGTCPPPGVAAPGCNPAVMPVETKIRPGLEIASLSDIGCARENNEDSVGYWEPAEDAEFGKRGRIAVVADGMGGYEGGQEASQMAVNTVIEIYSQSPVTDPQVALID